MTTSLLSMQYIKPNTRGHMLRRLTGWARRLEVGSLVTPSDGFRTSLWWAASNEISVGGSPGREEVGVTLLTFLCWLDSRLLAGAATFQSGNYWPLPEAINRRLNNLQLPGAHSHISGTRIGR